MNLQETKYKSTNPNYQRRTNADLEKSLRLTKLELKKTKLLAKNLRREINVLKTEQQKLFLVPTEASIHAMGVINGFFAIDINERTRTELVTRGRMMYYAFLRQNTKMSLKEIGNTIATKADHSTILHAISQHDKFYSIEKKYKAEFDKICETILI